MRPATSLSQAGLAQLVLMLGERRVHPQTDIRLDYVLVQGIFDTFIMD